MPQKGELIGGRFRVGLTLGKGAFGIVKSAVDEQEGKPVALKMLTPAAFADPELVARFMREARICSVLNHPNTVRLIEFGHIPVEDPDPDVPYMAMELVRGIPLGGVLKIREKLSDVETAFVLASVLDSLHDAHMNGVVHRDLKPNNIMITAPESRWTEPSEGKNLFVRLGIPGSKDSVWQDISDLDVKVVDFGLGKLLEIGDRQVKKLTRAGVGAGTAEYMSPEQVRGDQDVDHRADIYGVAMLIFRLLTGKPCFEAKSRAEIALKHLTQQPPPLPAEYRDHPLNAVYLRASQKDRDNRYATVEEMAWELRGSVDEDYEAIRALMESGMMEKPEFERPPTARRVPEKTNGESQQEHEEAKPQKRSILNRLFGRK